VCRQSCAILLCLFYGTAVAGSASNIAIENSHGWAENLGWLSFHSPDGATGVRVLPTILSGSVWAENAGWIHLGDGAPASGHAYGNLDGTDFGVNVDPVTGNLSGLAWGENIGWINFGDPTIPGGGSLCRVDFSARRLRGWAWAENAGWINLDHPVAFVAFDWPLCHEPYADADGDGDVDQVDFGIVQRCLSPGHVGIGAGCECFNRPEPPDYPRGDNDIDADDLDAFELCATGPAVPPDAACDD